MRYRDKVLIEDQQLPFILDTSHYLDLFQTLHILIFSYNLVSIGKLDVARFSFKIESFSLFKIEIFIGTRTLCNDLYEIKLDNAFVETLMTLYHNFGTKGGLVDETSAYLWYI